MSPTSVPCIHRVMIASLSQLPGSVVEQVLALRASMHRFNQTYGLRSALLYSAGWFVQWHEGGEEAIARVLAASQKHPGHQRQRVIHRSVGMRTLSDVLNIATLHGRDKPTDMARRIHQLERERTLGWAGSPLQIWQWLSAPCRARPDNPLASLARREVLVLGSQDSESVDLVKAIADRCDVQVNYQRFALGDGRRADTGGAYADLPCPGHTARVQALSRGALGNSLARLSLQQMQSLVLLLGERPRPAEALLATVGTLLAGMAHPPGVRLIAPSRAISEWARSRLSAVAGLDVGELDALPRFASRADAVLQWLCGRAGTQQPDLVFGR